MGSCMGRCLPQSDSRNHSILSRQNSGLDFSFLIEETASSIPEETKRSFLSRMFSKRKNRKKSKAPVLQLVDGILNPQGNPYSRLNESQQISKTCSYTSKDIPLQCLDARALLARTTTSTPASSLDLEWEHETIPVSLIHDPSANSWMALPEEVNVPPSPSESSNHNSVAPPGSDSDWSRVSSANSLEWDNVHSALNGSPPPSEIDTDTQLLLSEIERLTSQTLRETGQELFS